MIKSDRRYYKSAYAWYDKERQAEKCIIIRSDGNENKIGWIGEDVSTYTEVLKSEDLFETPEECIDYYKNHEAPSVKRGRQI